MINLDKDALKKDLFLNTLHKCKLKKVRVLK